MAQAFDLGQVKVKKPTFEVPIATHEQVIAAGDDYYIIDAATSIIVKEINDIDSRLYVKYNSEHDFFVLFAKDVIEGNECEYLVKTFQKLDPRIVQRVKEISDPSYDFIQEANDLEKQRDDEKLYAIRQKIGDTAERLASALRKDLGVKTHAYFDSSKTKKLVSEGKEFLGGVRTKDAKNS